MNSAVTCFFPWMRGKRSDNSDLTDLRSRFDICLIVLRRAAEFASWNGMRALSSGRKMIAQQTEESVMANWRMQLHPDAAPEAMKHAVESLAAGFIGLDFAEDVGDLNRVTRNQLTQQKPYLQFAHEMEVGDRVLVMVHHFPFALATVEGEYNYIRNVDSELGVWFRHFRRVRDVRYFADYTTDAHSWPRITMTDTICPLRRDDSASSQLIEEWLQATAGEVATVA